MTSVLSEAAEGAPHGAPSHDVYSLDDVPSSFGPCYQAIHVTTEAHKVGFHGEAIQVVIAFDQGKGVPLDPYPLGVERAKFIVKACNMHHELCAALDKINTLIYAKGADLGSDEYFEIRNLCVDNLRKAGVIT